MSARNTNGTALPGCGCPAFVVVWIDAMISAGLIDADALAGLDADRLTELAREAVRFALADFDANSVAALLAGKVAA